MSNSILSAVDSISGPSLAAGTRRSSPGKSGAGLGSALGEVGFDEVLSGLDFQNAEGDLSGLFELQLKMNRETIFFTGMSNIAKSRHEAGMNAVRNVRS